MGKLTVSYNNNSIIDTTNDGSFTLATEGKLMADDVSVAFEGGVSLTLEVNVDTGSAVTVTNGTTTLTGTSENGKCTFALPEAGTWTASATKDGKSSTTKTFNVETQNIANLAFVSTTLNDNEWSVIRAVSDDGDGANYWSVGDRKAVTLNGTVDSYKFSNKIVYAFIIGFDHNAEYEGSNRIHFQFGKTALSGGKDICFYNGTSSFPMTNISSTGNSANSGGWRQSYMRTAVCGTDFLNYSGTFIAVLPSDLRSVLKTVTKYTDNNGRISNIAGDATATTDIIFLLAVYEVFGTNGPGANANESAKQAQYAYYAAGNSKVKYQYSSQTYTSLWWLRSPCGYNEFISVTSNGEANGTEKASSKLGFAPAFCV